MTQKSAVRSRSKSTSRKSIIDIKSPNNEKNVKIDEKVDNKPITDNHSNIYRRITRQSIRATSCVSLDDWKSENDSLENVEINKIHKKVEKSINKANFEENKPFKWFSTIFQSFYSILFIVFFPIFVILLNKMCENGGGIRKIDFFAELKLEYFTNSAILLIVAIWLLYLCCLSVLPIGSSYGVTLADGTVLRYRCNGVLSFIISIAIISLLLYYKHLTTLWIYDNYYSLIGCSITLALIISSVVFVKSLINSNCKLATDSGNICYGFLMGREINPRIFFLDLKYFYEFRPGFISWTLLNIIFCVKDWEENEYRSINLSLLLCVACQSIYCFDSLLFEADVISKSFMINGRFGFIHCFGSQVIVPFLFTLTSRTIQINKIELPLQCLASIAILNFIGFVIYRGSNSQKNDFRRNPYSTHLSHLKTITTKKGQQLLVGGWWGLLRHPNYLGDIIMSVCWSLCGGSLLICYFYPLYFVIFIVNRCLQDEVSCFNKHGKAWLKYRQTVRYRLIPFIF